MQVNEHVLKRKGWTSEEISYVRLRWLKLDKQRDSGQKVLDQFVFALLVFLVLLVNVAVSYAFLPLVTIIEDASILGVLALAGVAFGFLLSSFFKGHEQGHPYRDVIAKGVIIVGSLILFGYTFKGAMIKFDHFLLAIAYVIPFSVPFMVRVKHGAR